MNDGDRIEIECQRVTGAVGDANEPRPREADVRKVERVAPGDRRIRRIIWFLSGFANTGCQPAHVPKGKLVAVQGNETQLRPSWLTSTTPSSAYGRLGSLIR